MCTRKPAAHAEAMAGAVHGQERQQGSRDSAVRFLRHEQTSGLQCGPDTDGAVVPRRGSTNGVFNPTDRSKSGGMPRAGKCGVYSAEVLADAAAALLRRADDAMPCYRLAVTVRATLRISIPQTWTPHRPPRRNCAITPAV